MNELIVNAVRVNLILLYQDMMTRTGGKVPATSTLARKPAAELQQAIQTYLDTTKSVKVETEDSGMVIFVDVEKKKSKPHVTSDLNDIITVTVEKFPGREGSASFERRKLYRSGMTVSEFLAANEDGKGRGSLRKAIRRGWVTVTSATGGEG